uniref:Large ribosomal subunit protein mL45 n=1 Tax=Strix occidentalis caurina TaxID=311401 RepID=A0A8D0F1N7_STROC
MVGLDDLQGLFQPRWFCDSVRERRAESRHLLTSCVRLAGLCVLIFRFANIIRAESCFSSPQRKETKRVLPLRFFHFAVFKPPPDLSSLHTADIMDPYVPPEGDARLSSLSKDGLKQKMEKLRQTATSQLALRKVKDHVPDFSTKTFPEKAQEIFIEAHNCLANFNKQKLHSLVTERCYPEMVRGNRYKTIRWSFLESLEPPRVVHVRCDSIVNRGNLYGQVTVRMHTRQTLAIYDRFGRLMYGGEQVPKDVLEYVVFERYLVNPYGAWRMHGKIVPEWAPPKDPIIKTVMIPGPTLDPSQEPWGEEGQNVCGGSGLDMAVPFQ